MRAQEDDEDHALCEPVTPRTVDPTTGEAFAWKLHGALQDWTGKIDTKASIVMTLETASLSGIVAFSGSRSSEYSATWTSLHRCGLVLLFTSIILVGAVVFPQLRKRDSVKSWQDQFIYFGHLRKWAPESLAEALAGAGANAGLQMLSDQIITMSRIAWRKHVLVQWSLFFALAGCLAVGIPLVAIT
jgi:hypothetical protein